MAKATLRAAGSRDEARSHRLEHAGHAPLASWRKLNRVLFVVLAAGAVWFLRGTPSPYVTGIGVLCAVVGGFPIFHEACEKIVHRRMTMELSMTIAIVVRW